MDTTGEKLKVRNTLVAWEGQEQKHGNSSAGNENQRASKVTPTCVVEYVVERNVAIPVPQNVRKIEEVVQIILPEV